MTDLLNNKAPCNAKDVLIFDSQNLTSYLDYLDTSNKNLFLFSKKINEELTIRFEDFSKMKNENDEIIRNDCNEVTKRVDISDFKIEEMQHSLESHNNKLFKLDEKFEKQEFTMNGLILIKDSLEQKGKDIERVLIINDDLSAKIDVNNIILGN